MAGGDDQPICACIDRQLSIVSARVAVADALHSMMRRQAEMDIESAASSMAVSNRVLSSLDVSKEHPAFRSVVQSVMALQQCSSDMSAKSAARCMIITDAYGEIQAEIKEVVRTAVTLSRKIKKEDQISRKAIEKSQLQCEKLSELAIQTHWAFLDARSHQSVSDSEVKALEKAAQMRKKEVIKADIGYAESIANARGAAIRHQREMASMMSSLVEADRNLIKFNFSNLAAMMNERQNQSMTWKERLDAVQEVLATSTATANELLEGADSAHDIDEVPLPVYIPVKALAMFAEYEHYAESPPRLRPASIAEPPSFWPDTLHVLLSNVPLKPTAAASVRRQGGKEQAQNRPPGASTTADNRPLRLPAEGSRRRTPKSSEAPGAMTVAAVSPVKSLSLKARCHASLQSADGRRQFSDAITVRRGSVDAYLLTPASFSTLSDLFGVFLSEVEPHVEDESRTIMSILVNAQAFYVVDKGAKRLLQTAVSDHDIFKGISLWRAAFMARPMESFERWQSEVEREDVTARNVDNAFGQLAGITNNMTQFGCTFQQVTQFVEQMALEAGLDRLKTDLLLKNVCKAFGEEFEIRDTGGEREASPDGLDAGPVRVRRFTTFMKIFR